MNARKSRAISTFSFHSASAATTIPTATSVASATRAAVCLMQAFSPFSSESKRQESGITR
jgi:hypothetical protein